MPAASRVEVLLATLNATDVGSLESIAGKMRQVQDELAGPRPGGAGGRGAGRPSPPSTRGDVAEFKRGRAFLQSKIGHLR